MKQYHEAKATAEDIIKFVEMFYTLYTCVEGHKPKEFCSLQERLEYYKDLQKIIDRLKAHGAKAKFNTSELRNVNKEGILYLLEEDFLEIVSESGALSWTFLRYINK